MSAAFISAQGMTKRYPDTSGTATSRSSRTYGSTWRRASSPASSVTRVAASPPFSIFLPAWIPPTEGHIIAAGKHVLGPSLDRAVIFQGHALLPWLTALANVELAVASRHGDWSRSQIREHAMKYLTLVHLDGSEL